VAETFGCSVSDGAIEGDFVKEEQQPSEVQQDISSYSDDMEKEDESLAKEESEQGEVLEESTIEQKTTSNLHEEIKEVVNSEDDSQQPQAVQEEPSEE
jgi:hypothetical protein